MKLEIGRYLTRNGNEANVEKHSWGYDFPFTGNIRTSSGLMPSSWREDGKNMLEGLSPFDLINKI